VKKLSILVLLVAMPLMAADTDMPGLSVPNTPAPEYNRALGDVLGSFAGVGATPVGLEHDGNGDLYQTAITDDTVYLITTGGAILSSFSVLPNTGNPIGVTTDGTSVWVTDTTGMDVDEYTLAGAYVGSFDVSALTTFPEGITFNPNTGNLYVVDGAGGAVVIEYTTAGVMVATFPINGSSQDGIAYDPVRNSYWIYDSGTDSVTHYDVAFTFLEAFPGTSAAGFGGGEGLAVIGDTCYIMGGLTTIVMFDLTGAVPVELQTFDVE